MASNPCDRCGQPFTPTPPQNPGTTYVSGFPDAPTKVLVLYLCNTCLPAFYATTDGEQQATAQAVNRAAP